MVPQRKGTAFDLPDSLSAEAGFTSGKAISSLLLGFVSLGCCFFAGVPAVIYGSQALRDINRSGGRVRGRSLAAAGVLLGGLGSTLVPALLIYPAVQSVRDMARRSECTNNLKQIALALHNFHDRHGRFPPASITDKQGQPLLSWRVAILPYLGPEGEALARQFNMNEPWDGPTNRMLFSKMPAVFGCPCDTGTSAGLTRYQVFVGPAGMFTGKRKGVRINEITDGTSNTLMVAEMATPVEWTAPSDPPYDPTLPLGGMGSGHPGGAHMLAADGAVRFVGVRSLAPLGALISRNGGEIVSFP